MDDEGDDERTMIPDISLIDFVCDGNSQKCPGCSVIQLFFHKCSPLSNEMTQDADFKGEGDVRYVVK